MIDALSAGESCFIDANILGYASIELPPFTLPCRVFLKRVAAGEIRAFTSANVVADALFRTMVIEVTRRFVPSGTKALTFLRNHPEVINLLVHYPAALEALARFPLELLPVDWNLIKSGTQISVRHGLLTNDAMIVALMRRHGLTHLVTNDDDFDHVPELKVWKPR